MKRYVKFLALESDDFETTIVDEANIPCTEDGRKKLVACIEKAEKKGYIVVMFDACSNTSIREE